MVRVYGICIWYMYMVYDSTLLRNNFACGAFSSGQLSLRRFFHSLDSYFSVKFHRCFNKRFDLNVFFPYSIISFD